MDEEDDESPEPTQDADIAPVRTLRCAACDLDVASADDVLPIEGAPIFVNPDGWVHEVVAVRRVTGVFHLGPLTTEFSWFPGYAWEMCHCGRCGAHLGWRYQATSPRALAEFWGLRRSQIRES